MRRANGRVGGKPRVLRDIVKAFRRPHRFARCRFACATGTAASQGFRTAHGSQMGRMACDVPHRYATRSWPNALGNRLYGSLSALLGISHQRTYRGFSSRIDFYPAVGYSLCQGRTVNGAPPLLHTHCWRDRFQRCCSTLLSSFLSFCRPFGLAIDTLLPAIFPLARRPGWSPHR